MKRIHAFLMLTIVVLLVAAVALPLAAQTATPDPSSLVLAMGPVDLTSGNVTVAGYIIVPGAESPLPVLHQGDVVIVIGYLLPDGITIQVVTFEFLVEPEVTPEVTPEATLEVTPEVTPEATLEVTPEITPEPEVCNFPNHPVALRIADAFHVSYEEVIAWHCRGFGFGEITRAYLIAEETGEAVETYFGLRDSGLGWGQIVRETGIHPSELAPGQVHRGGYDAEVTPEAGMTAIPLQGSSDGSDCPGNSCNAPGRGNNGNGNGGGRPDCPGNSCNAPGRGGNGNNGNGNGRGNGRGNGN